jgi:HAMP domain-containing protein
VIKRIPIRVKLAGALAVPLLLVVSVAWVEIANATRNVDDVKDETALATTTVGPGGLILALQNERDDASTKILGQSELLDLSVEDTDDVRAQTDTSLKQFKAVVSERDPEAAAAFTDAFRELDRLADIRKSVDEIEGPATLDNINVAATVFSRYTAVIGPLLDANADLRLSVDDSVLRNGAELLDQVSRLTESVARLNREVTFQILSGGLTNSARTILVADLVADYDNHLDGIRVLASGPFRKVAQTVVQGESYRAYRGLLGDYLQGREVDPTELITVPAATPSDRTYDALRDATSEIVITRANTLRDKATERQQTFVAAAFIGLLLALAITMLAARSITRPLRELTNQTDEMASRRLPEAVQAILDTPLGQDVHMPEVPPIRVRTRDEVADVAESLNTVQTRTLSLAVEQAVLRRNISDSFVNLGRRTQNLIGRQLDFITMLEHEEGNPDVLENLFKLDHLATRVRRNAESLVVLAGLDTARQWSAPVSMGDLVRSTIGEVEEYQRVVVRRVDPAKMPGAAATDLVHLMAELVENGLSFSPPDRDVEVAGHMSAEGYTLTIVDHGLGMSDEDLARSNQRLAGEESFTIAPSRYLGHYVAGHLAGRLHVAVLLTATPGGGITATITIPLEALASDELTPDAPELAASPNGFDPVATLPAAPVEPAPPAQVEAPLPATRSDGAPPAAPIRRQSPRPVEQAVGQYAAAPVIPEVPGQPAHQTVGGAPVRSRTPPPVRPGSPPPAPTHVPAARFPAPAPFPASSPAPPAPPASAPTFPASSPAPPASAPAPFPASSPAPPASAPAPFPPAAPAPAPSPAPAPAPVPESTPTPAPGAPAPDPIPFPKFPVAPIEPVAPARPAATPVFPRTPAPQRPLAPTARSNGGGTAQPVHRKREAAPDGGTTSNGLRKRVKGGQMPNQGGLLVNRRAQPAEAPADVAPQAAATTATDDDGSTTADNVFDFLSSFEAGAQRGRKEAGQVDDDPTAAFTTPTTDGN